MRAIDSLRLRSAQICTALSLVLGACAAPQEPAGPVPLPPVISEPLAGRADDDGCDGEPTDQVRTRELRRLQVFTSWLQQHGVQGYVGEVGWKSGRADSAQWQSLADCWYDEADRHRLWVTAWATGELWTSRYDALVYEPVNGRVAAPRPQAQVVESHPGDAQVLRGVNLAGAEFGAPSTALKSPRFSSSRPGRPGSDYAYPRWETWQYLVGRGVGLVRLPIRWERLQPRLGRALDPAEVARLEQALTDAASAGVRVVLDVHNYAGYYLPEGQGGRRVSLGSRDLALTSLADLWRRLVAELDEHPAVVAWDLMNEPTGMPGRTVRQQAELWEKASTAAAAAIRAAGSKKVIAVPGYRFSAVRTWQTMHPRPWVPASLGPVVYEAHQYFDDDGSGRYATSYDQQQVDRTARPKWSG